MSGTEGPIRIGDQEREEAVTQLGRHYEAGRLSAEEHQERVGEALQAKTEADLATLFADLPREGYAGTPGAGGPGSPGASGAPGSAGSPGDEQGWAGPWGWARPPWTAPSEQAGATGPGAAGPGGAAGRAAYGPGARGPWGGGRPPYGRGFFGRVPLPVLIALAVVGVLASIGCVVAGGHPPFLPLLLIVAGIFIVKKRQQERRA